MGLTCGEGIECYDGALWKADCNYHCQLDCDAGLIPYDAYQACRSGCLSDYHECLLVCEPR